MNHFRRQNSLEETPSKDSTKDNDPYDQLKMCKDKLKDMSNILRNLSNKL